MSVRRASALAGIAGCLLVIGAAFAPAAGQHAAAPAHGATDRGDKPVVGAVRTASSRTVRAGTTLGTLTIPRLGLSVSFRQGVDAHVLQFGPGHYPETKLPGAPGTVAIAGHRVTHTHPFLRINLLRWGDSILISARGRSFRYRVYAMRIVRPTAVWVLMRRSRVPRLVLTACHPPHRADLRIVVFARQVGPRTGTALRRSAQSR